MVEGDDHSSHEVILLELSECQLFIDRLRGLVDAHEALLWDALTFLPQERAEMPPRVPSDYLE
jgi:hypothetical protein